MLFFITNISISEEGPRYEGVSERFFIKIRALADRWRLGVTIYGGVIHENNCAARCFFQYRYSTAHERCDFYGISNGRCYLGFFMGSWGTTVSATPPMTDVYVTRGINIPGL